MNILHVCAGWEETNGAAVIARHVALSQSNRGDEVSFAVWATPSALRRADEVWVHCGWLPCLWWAGLFARRVVRMPEACYDPVRLAYHAWKKRLAAPIEKLFLRRAHRIAATCEAEKGWIESYLGRDCPPVEIVDVKQFFSFPSALPPSAVHSGRPMHLLYLGRRHPLKGVRYLEEAVKDLAGIELKIVSDARGEEKERVWEWCDVLVLPTLSDNFGLVVAEALERGKRVVTTDGAPAWRGQPGVVYVEGFRDGTDAERVRLLHDALVQFSSSGASSRGDSP